MQADLRNGGRHATEGAGLRAAMDGSTCSVTNGWANAKAVKPERTNSNTERTSEAHRSTWRRRDTRRWALVRHSTARPSRRP